MPDARDDGPAPERVALLLFLATFLFVGSLRAFLSAVYYDNLVALELGPTAAYALLLLAPVLFLARLPLRTTLVASGVALAVARCLLAPVRGTALHLPLAGVAAASWLLMLGALLPTLKGQRAVAAAIGAALGWALDVAMLWFDGSADPTRGLRGLLVLVPVAGLLVLTLLQLAPRAEPTPTRGGWLAGGAFGAWLFLQNTLAANAYGAARWNGAEPALVAAGALAGLALGATWLARLGAPPPLAIVVLGLSVLVAVADHALFHSPIFPLVLLALAFAMVAHLALLLPRLAPRALILAGFVTLVLHFVYAFTYLFDFVPLSAVWEGRAPVVYLAAVAILALGIRPWDGPRVRPALGRALPILVAVPLLVGLVAVATPGASVGEAREGSLRVLTFNVHQGFANDGTVDPSVFVPLLEEADADIVFLQEADTPRFTSGNLDVAGYLAERLGYHLAYGQPTRAQAFGGALLSRLPIEEWRAYELPSESDDRWYLEARVNASGRDVWLYSVHFALPHGDRVAQTEALLAQAGARPGAKILAGDLNSCPGGLCAGYEEGVQDDVYALMTAAYVDAWVAAGHAVDGPEAYTYEANDPHERIDHIYVSGDLPVAMAERIRTPAALQASDHLPVLVELRLP